MQPIYSPVDHESRHSSSIRVEDADRSGERTPLITARQLTTSIVESRSPATTLVVTTLLLILLIGVVIGVYLLIEEEDVMPPVENALQLVMRWRWDGNSSAVERPALVGPAEYAVVVDTGTDTCGDALDCNNLLRSMQTKYKDYLPYNFLVSSQGHTYEELGWRHMSPLFPQIANTSLVLAFIGNFTTSSPTKLQVEASRRLFEESVSQERLSPHFKLIGKKTLALPKYLFQTLQNFPEWDPNLSDF